MGTGVSPKRIATGNILFSSSFLDLKTKQYIKPLLISLERRWSSRTFRYGYLVTTSPQLPAPPSAALSRRSPQPNFFVSHLSMCPSAASFTPHIALAMLVVLSLHRNTYPASETSNFSSGNRPVESLTSGVADSHGVTGGVYKTRERIHRSILICDY